MANNSNGARVCRGEISPADAPALLFLDEKGIRSYDKLCELADMKAEEYHSSSDSIKELESRITDLKDLRQYIINYSNLSIFACFRPVSDRPP